MLPIEEAALVREQGASRAVCTTRDLIPRLLLYSSHRPQEEVVSFWVSKRTQATHTVLSCYKLSSRTGASRLIARLHVDVTMAANFDFSGYRDGVRL